MKLQNSLVGTKTFIKDSLRQCARLVKAFGTKLRSHLCHGKPDLAVNLSYDVSFVFFFSIFLASLSWALDFFHGKDDQDIQHPLETAPNKTTTIRTSIKITPVLHDICVSTICRSAVDMYIAVTKWPAASQYSQKTR